MKKNCLKFLLSILALVFCCVDVSGQSGTISVVAGGGCYGFAGDGGAATASGVCFNNLSAVTVDLSGNIFIADQGNLRIRKVDATTGIITTIAGTGIYGYSGDGGPATSAKIGYNLSLGTDRFGNCYFSDPGNHRIRKIDAVTGVISTVAGNGAAAYYGNGGAATSAALARPSGMYIDTSTNIFFIDGSTIRKVAGSTGLISLFAGDSSLAGSSGDGGPATAALLYADGIIGDKYGNIYVSTIPDLGLLIYGAIRKIDLSGIITTIAGNFGSLYNTGCPATATGVYPVMLGIDSSNNLYFNDFNNATLKKIQASTGMLNTIQSNFGSSVSVTPAGDIFYKYGAFVKRLVGAFSNIDSCIVNDSLLTPLCSLPSKRGFSVYGTINGVPSSSDSVLVTIDLGDNLYGHTSTIRTLRLPYWFASGSYGFGSRTALIDTYTYTQPGIYNRKVTIQTLGGYFDVYYFTDTIRTRCSSGITVPTELYSYSDSISSIPCVFPATVDFTFNGVVPSTLYTSGADSVYIIIDYGDSSALEWHLLPYSAGVCTYAGRHSYASPSVYYTPHVYFCSTNGISSNSSGIIYPIFLDPCVGGAISVTIDYDSSTSNCRLPDTVLYHYSGRVFDSAAMNPTAVIHVSYGDGSDETITALVNNDGHGTYSMDGYFSHVFNMAGSYMSYHNDTANNYYGGTYVHYGTTGSILVLGTSCSPVSGSFYIDSNANCIQDGGEILLSYWPYALVNNTLGITTYGWCDDSGRYSLSVVDGYSYTIISDPFGAGSSGATLSLSCPSSGTFTFTATAGTTITQDFGFTCVTPTTVDMGISGWGGGFIPGNTGYIQIWASNPWGFMCDTLSCDVYLVVDTNLRYVGMSSGPAPTSISGDTLTWHFATSRCLLDFSATVRVYTDTMSTIYDTICTRLYVSPTRIADTVLSNNTYVFRQPVRSSFDPNEKQVSPQGFGAQGFIPAGTPLSYLVHFQNTGSAPARNVTVSDTISGDLDLSTLQVVGSSSAVLVYNIVGNVVNFRFNDINLPDSTTDPTGSIGYIAYNIVPRDSLSAGTQIRNTVGIFFDYNSAIVTNTTLNTIEDTLGGIYGPDSVCVGSNITLVNHIPGGVWATSNGHATISGGVVSGVSPGIDTITYTVYGDQSITKIVRVNPVLGVVSISGATTVCTGSSITLTPSLAGGAWSSGSAAVVTVGGGVVTGIAAGSDSVYYTVVNSCGSSRASVLITSYLAPVAGTISGATVVCVGAITTLSPSVTGGTWSSVTSSIATVAGGVVTGITAGSDSVLYTVTNSCGSATASVLITVNPLPSAGGLSGVTSLCSGTTITLTPSVAGGSWSSSSSSVATVSGGVITGIAAGTAIISYSVSNSCGTAVAASAITVNSAPSAGSVSGSSSVCVGASITLTASVTGGIWSCSSSATATVAGGIVTGISGGTNIIYYTVTNSCGVATVGTAIAIVPLPSAVVISGPSAVCVGAAITLTPSVTGGTWTSGATSIATVSGGAVTGVSAGVAVITYSVSNSCGAADTTFPVTVNPMPYAGSVYGVDSICIGDTTTFGDAAPGGTWSSSSTAIATIAPTGLVTGIATGATVISYTASNSCGSVAATHTLFVRLAADCPTEIKEVATAMADVSIFPNPNEGIFTISIPAHENDAVISIIDVNGKTVKTLIITDNKQLQVPVELKNIATGVYMLRAQVDGTVYYRKVVVM